MAKIIVVTSGKGGVGKTTTSASIASGLALRGHKTAVIDFDVGLRNLDLIMGCERRVVYDLINVIQGEATLNQALIKDKHCDKLFILPASQTRDKDALTKEGVEKVLNTLTGEMGFEFVICDSPAGIEQGALMALYFADEAIVTTNPEVSSVRDSDRILGILQSKSRKSEQGGKVKEHLLITRYSPERVEKGEMLSVDDICDILRMPRKKASSNVCLEVDMSLIDILFGKKQKSAEVARDRLQIIIAQERVKAQAPDYLPTLQKELLEVLSKYVNVSLDDIRISQEKQDGLDVLELNITLPDQQKKA